MLDNVEECQNCGKTYNLDKTENCPGCGMHHEEDPDQYNNFLNS